MKDLLVSINKEQVEPTKNDEVFVWDEVIKDLEKIYEKLSSLKENMPKELFLEVRKNMKERDNIGKERYNTRLQPFNNRDALIDAVQEGYDLLVYIKQQLLEDQKNHFDSEIETDFDGKEISIDLYDDLYIPLFYGVLTLQHYAKERKKNVKSK